MMDVWTKNAESIFPLEGKPTPLRVGGEPSSLIKKQMAKIFICLAYENATEKGIMNKYHKLFSCHE